MATTLRQSRVQRFSCAVPTSLRMDRDVAYWPEADMIIASCIVGFSKQSGYANFLNKFLLRFLKPVGSHNSYSAAMPRPRCRVCLQDGIKLDLNDLARKGFIKFGANIGARGIVWSSSSERQIASCVITADMTAPSRAWLRIAIGQFEQRITLVSRKRQRA